MDKVLGSEFQGRAVKTFVLWRLEILSVIIFFSCAVFTFEGLWRLDHAVTQEISGFESRLSFIKRYFPHQNFPAISLKQTKKADAAQVISGIRLVAQRTGVAIDRLAIGSEQIPSKERVSILPVEFSASLPQGALMPFVEGLRNMDFLCRIVFLNAKPDASSDSNLRLSLRMERLSLLSPVTRDVLTKAAFDFKPEEQGASVVPVAGKNIFKNILQPARRVVEAASQAAEGLAVSDLNLVGIVNDGQPKAVIEDKKASKTYYLVKDDEIGGMRVAEILEQEVILEKGGTRYNLTL